MIPEEGRRAASRSLLAAERDRRQVPGPSRSWPDITLDDAYAIAAMGIASKLAQGAELRGRKVGLTSRAMQRSSAIDEPDFGVLLADMFFEDGARIARDAYCVPRVEMELAFVMGRSLVGPVTRAEVLAATDHILPAIELIDARAEDPRTVFDTVSDNGAAAGVILGSDKMRPTDVDLRWVGGILESNGAVEETGLAAGVLGHPADAVVWLADKLAGFGQTIEAGELVLTGSFVRPVWAEAGTVIVADFGDWGTVHVSFT
ncbi:MAG TPA: fumarylacetoacetate hydrolase family protein [Acidimicrobiia bacterium]|nr:fumarylacetoacetate hydrolase family protein [Acidimicrobiia bacterium]